MPLYWIRYEAKDEHELWRRCRRQLNTDQRAAGQYLVKIRLPLTAGYCRSMITSVWSGRTRDRGTSCAGPIVTRCDESGVGRSASCAAAGRVDRTHRRIAVRATTRYGAKVQQHQHLEPTVIERRRPIPSIMNLE